MQLGRSPTVEAVAVMFLTKYVPALLEATDPQVNALDEIMIVEWSGVEKSLVRQ